MSLRHGGKEGKREGGEERERERRKTSWRKNFQSMAILIYERRVTKAEMVKS